MKKAIYYSVILVAVLVIVINSASAGPVAVLLNGIPVDFPDQMPYIDSNGRTMVPVRFVSQALGAEVEWDEVRELVNIHLANVKYSLAVNCSQVVMLTEEAEAIIEIDTVSVMRNGRLMVPLRFISEAMGAKVTWEESTGSVLVDNLPISSAVEPPPSVPSLIVTDFTMPPGVYFPHEEINISLTIANTGSDPMRVWLTVGFEDRLGQTYQLPFQEMYFNAGQATVKELNWVVPPIILSGSHRGVVTIWDDHPESETANAITQGESSEGPILYNTQENFFSFNNEVWRTSNSMLEGTSLRRTNVTVEDGLLTIHMPQGALQGGEIYSRKAHSFGAYEVRMKLPNAPSSITGFFLYRQPGHFHEIDIEVYNETSGDFFLTTYSEGSKQNLHLGTLPFDPTNDFHTYRIEYYPHSVSFYIDDALITEWFDGFTQEPMFLIINCWYPDWLEGTPPKSDEYLYVDWIRY